MLTAGGDSVVRLWDVATGAFGDGLGLVQRAVGRGYGANPDRHCA